jgi:hypothetical protein
MTDTANEVRRGADGTGPVSGGSTPSGDWMTRGNAAAAPYASTASGVHGALDAVVQRTHETAQHVPIHDNPRAVNAARGGAGILGAAGLASSGVGMRDAYRQGNTTGMVDNAISGGASALQLASAAAPAVAALSNASNVAGIGATAYQVTRQVDGASGETAEFLGMSGLEAREGRGVNARPIWETDNRNVTDRLGDGLADMLHGPARDTQVGPVSDATPQAQAAQYDRDRRATMARQAFLMDQRRAAEARPAPATASGAAQGGAVDPFAESTVDRLRRQEQERRAVNRRTARHDNESNSD